MPLRSRAVIEPACQSIPKNRPTLDSYLNEAIGYVEKLDELCDQLRQALLGESEASAEVSPAAGMSASTVSIEAKVVQLGKGLRKLVEDLHEINHRVGIPDN